MTEQGGAGKENGKKELEWVNKGRSCMSGASCKELWPRACLPTNTHPHQPGRAAVWDRVKGLRYVCSCDRQEALSRRGRDGLCSVVGKRRTKREQAQLRVPDSKLKGACLLFLRSLNFRSKWAGPMPADTAAIFLNAQQPGTVRTLGRSAAALELDHWERRPL